MQKDIFDNIVPYLRRNYDSKIHRAIIKSHCLPMIFNPIHYFSKTTNNDWFIYYYAINKKFSKDAACIAASEVQTEEGTYVYEYIIAGEHNIYIFPPHFFSRYHSRFVKDTEISKQELINQFIRRYYQSWRTHLHIQDIHLKRFIEKGPNVCKSIWHNSGTETAELHC